jgi:hydrogenase maturation protease
VTHARQKSPVPLVLGCGFPDRGDDAAGLFVARRLKQLGWDAREQSGEVAALLTAFEQGGPNRTVILVDAVQSGAPPGTVIRWDARAKPLPRESFHRSVHGLGVAEAVELARVLGKLPGSLLIYGIEGASFEAGAPPCPEVLAGVEEAVRRILEEV